MKCQGFLEVPKHSSHLPIHSPPLPCDTIVPGLSLILQSRFSGRGIHRSCMLPPQTHTGGRGHEINDRFRHCLGLLDISDNPAHTHSTTPHPILLPRPTITRWPLLGDTRLFNTRTNGCLTVKLQTHSLGSCRYSFLTCTTAVLAPYCIHNR